MNSVNELPAFWDTLITFMTKLIEDRQNSWTLQTIGGSYGFAPYVQALQEHDNMLLLEATSSKYLEPPLTQEQHEVMLFLGWRHFREEMYPNYSQIIDRSLFAPNEIAILLAKTLHFAYGVDDSFGFGIIPDYLGEISELLETGNLDIGDEEGITMSDQQMREVELKLAGEIADCPLLAIAKNDKSKACFKVVNEQSFEVTPGSLRQRPEPWMGNLAHSKVLFISSNPSINDDPMPLGENFPTFDWSVQDSADFFVNRLNPNNDPVHVTFNHPILPNFITRAIDGEYRNGLKRPRKPQHTWKKIHDRADELILDGANPAENYAITEVVHCKSRKERGVKKASSTCISLWMNKIVETSPAKVLVIVGSAVRDNFAKPTLGVHENFGSTTGYKSMTQLDRALRDIRLPKPYPSRLAVFNFHPAGFEHPQKLVDAYGVEVLTWLRKVVNGDVDVPANSQKLEILIRSFF